MKRFATHRAFILVALLVAAGARGADGASQEPTIQLFLQACAIPYTHLALVEMEVRDLGFAELAGGIARQYLGGSPGRAWAGRIQSKRFVVALRPEVLCTVIAHDGTPGDIKAAVESWLPSPSAGVSVTKEVAPSSGALETTMYELRGGKVQERWVVTISSEPSSETRAMLSWSRL